MNKEELRNKLFELKMKKLMTQKAKGDLTQINKEILEVRHAYATVCKEEAEEKLQESKVGGKRR